MSFLGLSGGGGEGVILRRTHSEPCLIGVDLLLCSAIVSYSQIHMEPKEVPQQEIPLHGAFWVPC